MRSKLLALAILFALTSVAMFVQFSLSQTPRPWRGFTFTDVPAEIQGVRGQTVSFNGGVLNTGSYWLGDFNITLSGLPAGSQYTVTPSHFEDVMIVREWNPQQGVYRIPQNFSVSIKVPEDASGVYLVNIVGQEFRSWYKYSNSTQILLKISGNPQFTITDIVFPETVTQSEPFNVTFTVKNGGTGFGSLNVRIDAPSDWTVSSRVQSVSLDAGASKPVSIEITPTNTSGNISIYADYPSGGSVINMTQNGPYLTPAEQTPSNEQPSPTSGYGALVGMFKGIGPIVFAIGVILLIVIVWNVWAIYKDYKSKKEPEDMKSAKKSVSCAPQTTSSDTTPASNTNEM